MEQALENPKARVAVGHEEIGEILSKIEDQKMNHKQSDSESGYQPPKFNEQADENFNQINYSLID